MLWIVTFMFVAPACIKLSYSQIVQPNFRSSDVELHPSLMVMNSTSYAHFYCTNYHPENLPLVVSLSRNISNKLLKLSTYQVNETTTKIILHSKRFIGIFYLFCYKKDNEQRGTRADVIVKADAGLLRLARRCQVYHRKYIKCTLRASTLARAIQNGFSPEIEFIENTEARSYKEDYEFLKNESTNNYLVFRLEPMVEGQFPAGVKMNIKITLPYFGTSQYRFDMTPTFVIQPNFTAHAVSKNKVEIHLIPNSPPAICQQAIQLKSNATKKPAWKILHPGRTQYFIDKSLLRTIYQVCVRCRQTSNESYSQEECQDIVLSPKYNSWKNIVIPVGIILSIILVILASIRLYIWISEKRAEKQPKPTQLAAETLVLNNGNIDRCSKVTDRYDQVIFDNESSFITETESQLTPDTYQPLYVK
ncbi:unnamed protein product [Adineta ricciae]|uniref:Uncharacterized protein n=1 Tax=Adineta ricciae TaxID=249248 RepID=A0A813MG11_ADIRI|nr:unnamed protein product [Adineta ricciae]CAF0858064.1 unnamed protein product [Adineta ricciae]